VVKIQLGGDHNVNSTLPERAVRICRSQKLVLSVNHQLTPAVAGTLSQAFNGRLVCA